MVHAQLKGFFHCKAAAYICPLHCSGAAGTSYRVMPKFAAALVLEAPGKTASPAGLLRRASAAVASVLWNFPGVLLCIICMVNAIAVLVCRLTDIYYIYIWHIQEPDTCKYI